MDRTDQRTDGRPAPPQHPDPQPGPHHYVDVPEDVYRAAWPYFWPDGQRAARGVLPTWQDDTDWRIGRDELPGGVVVSTVFLALDHSWGIALDNGQEFPPVLWETMIFRPDGGADPQARYTSRAAAVEGHAAAVLLEGATDRRKGQE